MRQCAIQGQVHIEMCVIAFLSLGRCSRIERYHDVCIILLWSDIGSRIRFADIQFAQHLWLRVPALCGVAADLPAPSQLLRWIEKDTHTVGAANLLPVHAKQPLNDQEGLGDDVLWWPKVASLVVVVGLQDGLAGTKQLQVLCHHIKIIACRVQRCDAQFLALLPIIAMIVVCAEHRDTLRTQNLGDTSTQRRFARGAVSHDSQDDRTRARSK